MNEMKRKVHAITKQCKVCASYDGNGDIELRALEAVELFHLWEQIADSNAKQMATKMRCNACL